MGRVWERIWGVSRKGERNFLVTLWGKCGRLFGELQGREKRKNVFGECKIRRFCKQWDNMQCYTYF